MALAAACMAMPAWALDAEETTNISVYEKAAPAVVGITVTLNGEPTSGTGALIDPSGIILTSSHVVGGASVATVTLASGETAQGRVLAQASNNPDLALLKITSPTALPFIPLGHSQAVRVGQKVFAIGNPYGFDRTLTLGIVSRIDPDRKRIQTDAPINPGSSGGPLLSSDGELIGIAQSIFNPDGRRTHIGIGFAVPVDAARLFIHEVATLPASRFRQGFVSGATSQSEIPVGLLKDFRPD